MDHRDFREILQGGSIASLIGHHVFLVFPGQEITS
jgi:hypothetical protein